MTKANEGRSRWVVMAKTLIPCRDGTPYLFRRRVLRTPWFGIFLHDIYESDSDRDPHNHPWPFVSIVLRGHYVERVYPQPGDPRHWAEYVVKRHGRWSAHWMNETAAHRVVKAAPGLKTLILVGRRRDEGWGFFRCGTYVPWGEYEHLMIPEEDEITLSLPRSIGMDELGDDLVTEFGYPGWTWTSIDMDRGTLTIRPKDRISQFMLRKSDE